MIKFIFGLLLVMASFSLASESFSASAHHPINNKLAERLAAEGANYNERGMIYDHQADGEFLIIEQTGLAGDALDWFAVNRWTGDVWEVMWKCNRLSTPALKKSQDFIKSRFSDVKKYKRLKLLRPTC